MQLVALKEHLYGTDLIELIVALDMEEQIIKNNEERS